MIGNVLQSRYHIETELGRGGMGVIYSCQDILLHRKVAIKILSGSELDAEGKRRWLSEARAAAGLNHPNIVTVYDAGQVEGTPFIVMELVEGPSLREIERPSIEEILNYVIQIAAALAHAHDKGVIHRDLKPENVVLTSSGTLKLMDFGLANSLNNPQISQPDALEGTFTYLAPEMIRGAEASPQSDLYALGVMLFELLTGRAPFESDDLVQLLGQHLHAAVKPPNTLRPDIPEDVNNLVVRLLSKQPAERPASAGDVQQEIQCILENTPLESPAPPAGVTKAPRHNLPLQRSRFVGRQKELTQIQKRLFENPLVTLIGSGGVGKTRLALQAARQGLLYYPEGAWLVELASLTDPTLVVQAVAAALGIQDEENKPLLDALTEYMSTKTLVLVLDNCEHLISTCAHLVEHLLAHCKNLHILATSREALGIEGEVIVNIQSLSLPSGDLNDPETVAQSEAAQLFSNRAASFLPGFQIDKDNAGQIAQICLRLDGIPLALELAASRVKILELGQIAQRLDDAFRLLTGGSRTALPRQQTLQATIDWSYNLLTGAEREMLRRLSIFAGGWSLEAAEVVCSGQPTSSSPLLEAGEILDLLTRLVDKSLVIVERWPRVEPRFHLLETIRQYAQEKLRQDDETTAIRHNHSRYYLQFAEQAAAGLHGPDQVAWLARLDKEHDNLRAALTWLLEEKAGEACLQMAGSMAEYWDMRGFLSEGKGWLEKALSSAEGSPPSAACIQAMYRLAGLIGRLGDMRVIDLAEKGYKLAEKLGDKRNMAEGLTILGIHAFYLGEQPQQAEELCKRGIQLWREIGDERGLGHALGPLAGLKRSQGDFEGATRTYQASLRLFRKVGDLREIAGALGNLADVALDQGNLRQAQEWSAESQELYGKLKDKHGIATALRTQACALYQQGEYQEAKTFFERSMRLFAEISDPGCLAITSIGLGGVMLKLGDLSKARQLAEESLKKLEQEVQEKIPALLLLARVALAEEDVAVAREWFAQALELSKRIEARRYTAEAEEGLAQAR
jgi:predicted ATPase/predicted Ser/Thr protein kinase